jgi:hypothetical protein
MSKAIDRIIDLLPVPLLIACGIVIACGWILKEVRSVPTIGDVLRDSWFQVGCVITCAGILAFYASTAILARSGPRYFSDKERGIFVARFDGDSENKVQREAFESLLDEIAQAQSLNDVHVVRIPNVVSDPDAATQLLKKSRASVAIWGSFVPPERVHVSITTYPDGGEVRVPLEKFPDVKPLTSKILDFLQLTPPPPGAKSEDQIAFLKKRIEVLEQQQQPQRYPSDIPALTAGISKLKHMLVLAVGIDTNVSQQIPRLRYARTDALALAQLFREQKATQTYVLTGSEANRATILNAMQDIRDRVTPDDTLLIYWAGTVYKSGDISYLVPWDGSITEPLSTLISASTFLDAAKATGAGRVVLLFDTSFAGRVVTGADSVTTVHTSSSNTGQSLAVFSSSGSNESAIESGTTGHSLFAYALIQGLGGAADLNGDGVVTVRELGEYVRQEVTAMSTKFGFPQHPTVFYEGAVAQESVALIKLPSSAVTIGSHVEPKSDK